MMGIGPEKNESTGSFRVGRGEQHAHRTAFGLPKKGSPLGTDSVHDGANIIHPNFEVGDAANAVREAGATLIEQDEPRKACDTRKEINPDRVLPIPVKVGDEARNVDEIEIALSQYLISDAHVAALGIAGLRRFHGRLPSWQPGRLPRIRRRFSRMKGIFCVGNARLGLRHSALSQLASVRRDRQAPA